MATKKKVGRPVTIKVTESLRLRVGATTKKSITKDRGLVPESAYLRKIIEDHLHRRGLKVG